MGGTEKRRTSNPSGSRRNLRAQTGSVPSLRSRGTARTFRGRPEWADAAPAESGDALLACRKTGIARPLPNIYGTAEMGTDSDPSRTRHIRKIRWNDWTHDIWSLRRRMPCRDRRQRAWLRELRIFTETSLAGSGGLRNPRIPHRPICSRTGHCDRRRKTAAPSRDRGFRQEDAQAETKRNSRTRLCARCHDNETFLRDSGRRR